MITSTTLTTPCVRCRAPGSGMDPMVSIPCRQLATSYILLLKTKPSNCPISHCIWGKVTIYIHKIDIVRIPLQIQVEYENTKLLVYITTNISNNTGLKTILHDLQYRLNKCIRLTSSIKKIIGMIIEHFYKRSNYSSFILAFFGHSNKNKGNKIWWRCSVNSQYFSKDCRVNILAYYCTQMEEVQ